MLYFLISWILSSKKDCFVLLTISLNFFQSRLNLDTLYIIKLWLHSSFHYALECLVILTLLEYLFQRLSEVDINSHTTLLSDTWSEISEILILPISFFSSMMKSSSFSLFLMIVWMNSSLVVMFIIKEVWSIGLHKSGSIEWLLRSSELE